MSVASIISAAYAETREAALLRLLEALDAAGYSFTCPTNATIAHNRDRCGVRPGRGLREVFGWSLDFARTDLPPEIFEAAAEAGVLEDLGGRYRSQVRASRVLDRLFLHSAYPTDQRDSVFLGPDSYRFARMIRAQALAGPAAQAILDIGVGAGVGALTAGLLHRPTRLAGTDVNRSALALARVNARHAGLELETAIADGAPDRGEVFDLILANPPFISGSSGRAYRDGGSQHGSEMSLAWVRQAMALLTAGGRMLLYTGSAIIAGTDSFAEDLRATAAEAGWIADYEELDPDIFGGMLRKEAYAEVERIAAVCAVIRKPWTSAPGLKAPDTESDLRLSSEAARGDA